MNSRFEQHHESNWWSQMSRPHFLHPPESLQEISLSEEDLEHELAAVDTDLPLSLHLPEPFEPRYHYPVVIWLHQDESNEDELHTIMPQISDQNYIGLAFRGTSDDGQTPSGHFHWEASQAKREELLEEIRETIAEMSRFFRMDMNRIYLAGFDAGATVALELLLDAPELFAGAIALGGAVPPTDGFGSRFRELSKRKAWLGWGRQDSLLDTKTFREQADRLERTGLQVETALYNCGHELTPEMLREINRWLMTGCRTVFV
ncbi:MAG: hypothetical protein HUJ26_06060 [Planctomycetaceae bacterium]|nr:hypothetical protein [Planctomycetaceae bacterium]